MAELHIALQAGFSNDTVSIHVDDNEVFNKTAITNSNHFGPAATVELNLPPGRRQVTVSVPTRQAAALIPVDLGDDPLHLGILLTPDGEVTYQVAHEPFHYL